MLHNVTRVAMMEGCMLLRTLKTGGKYGLGATYLSLERAHGRIVFIGMSFVRFRLVA